MKLHKLWLEPFHQLTSSLYMKMFFFKFKLACKAIVTEKIQEIRKFLNLRPLTLSTYRCTRLIAYQ